jgi:hypothetical protein
MEACMRAIAGLAGAALLAAIVGCGSLAVTHHQRVGDRDHDPVIPIIVPVHCLHLRPVPGQRTVSLSLADNHKAICVRRGTGVFVFLHSPNSHLWSPILSSSAVLSRRPSGVMSLMRGETGAFYAAAHVGRATLTSSVSRCPNGPHPSARARCPAPIMFWVTVSVLP